MSLWLIACKHTGENLIGPCVESIQAHHPGDRILVVDSCSEDLSYLQHLEGVEIATGNKHYPIGAWRYARQRQENFFYFIHDSTILTANISHIETEPCSVYSTFAPGYGPDIAPYIDKIRSELRLDEESWVGVFGPMLMCQRHVFQELRGAGLFHRLPKTKAESNAWERLLGMLIAKQGIQISHEVHPWMVKQFRERA